MTPEELQTKCEQISHFIHYELPNWIDSAVFTQNSFKVLESGKIDHSESDRNSQFELNRNSQCTLAN